jgi:RPAP1-like, N-terminal
MAERPLVGAVVERKPTAPGGTLPTFASSTKSGFPLAQHRSKSSFAKARNQQKTSRPTTAPALVHSHPGPAASLETKLDEHDWRRQMSEENDRKVDNMTEEEREQERRDIYDQLGHGVGDILKIVRTRKAEALQPKEQLGRNNIGHDNAEKHHLDQHNYVSDVLAESGSIYSFTICLDLLIFSTVRF